MSVDVVNKVELNLGPFNCCVEDVHNVAKVEYPVQFYAKSSQQPVRVFYYLDESIIESREVSDTFTLPMFSIKYQSDKHNTQEGYDEIVNKIELRIVSMIYKMISKMGISLCIDRIVIPVRVLRTHYTGSMSYGWAEIGIAIFV